MPQKVQAYRDIHNPTHPPLKAHEHTFGRTQEACSHALSRTFEPWGLGQVLRETKVTGKQWRLKLMHICKSSKLMHK